MNDIANISPAPSPVSWQYSFEQTGKAVATYPGDVFIAGDINSGYFGYASVAALQAASVLPGTPLIQLAGYYQPGDGGGATYIPAAAGAGPGKIQSADGQWWIIAMNARDAKMFGAKGDNSTPNDAAFVAAAAFGLFSVTAGSAGSIFKTSANTSIAADVTMDGTAVISPATGTTLTFNGGFSAPIAQVFTNAVAGQGAIAFNEPTLQLGYPEWWGAVTNNAAVNNVPPILACHAACGTTQLQAGNYYTTQTLALSVSNRNVFGAKAPNATDDTQILVQSGTLDCILVGLSSDPGSINAFATGINVSNIIAARTSAVVPPTVGNEINGASGFRVQYNLYGVFNDCTAGGSFGHSVSWNIENIVGTKFYRCNSFRSTVGTTSTNDIYYGLGLFGIGPYYLESIEFLDCTGSNPLGPSITLAIGINLTGTFTDTNILRPEYDGMHYGVYGDGTGEGKPSVDNLISEGRFDVCMTWGIHLQNYPGYSVLNVTNNYVSLQNTTTVGAYYFGNCNNVTFTGNEAIGLGDINFGLYLSNTSAWCSGNTYTDFGHPIEMSGALNCQIRDKINQTNTNVAASTGAIVLNSAVRNIVECTLQCTNAGMVPIGVQVDSASQYNETKMSGINPFGLPGSASATKLVYNGTNVTTASSYGTGNLASGIMS